MGKISPSLDEAAESVGSRGLRKFWDITFPLTTPGYVSGALLVFIWTFADFATPLVVGICDRVAVLNHGKKIADGPPDHVSRDPAVVEAYLGRGFAQGAAAHA